MGLQPVQSALQPGTRGILDGVLVTMLLAVGETGAALLIDKIIKQAGKAKATPFLKALNGAIVASAKANKIKL